MRRLAAALLLWPIPAAAQEGDVPSAPAGGDAQSALEARIVEMNPCEPLGADIAGLTLGLGEVRSVEVRRADVRIRGDGISVDITGRLTCRGAEEAPDRDLAADISASVEGILSRCEVTGTDVEISETEGEMAWALDLAAPVIQGLLISQIQEDVTEACAAFAK